MTLEQRLRRVPPWVWVLLAVVALILACCMGAGIGAASSDAAPETTTSSAPAETSTPPVVETSTTPAETAPVVSSDPCIDREHCVSPENLDAAWPLTVPWVEVSCLWHYGDQKQAMVYVTAPDDQSYAVNGTAQAFLDMPKIDLIWADSGIAGVKVNIEPLTNVGLLLCK